MSGTIHKITIDESSHKGKKSPIAGDSSSSGTMSEPPGFTLFRDRTVPFVAGKFQGRAIVIPKKPVQVRLETVESVVCSLNKDALLLIREKYSIPESVLLRLPRPNERACTRSEVEMCLYQDALVTGLRFPIHAFIVGLLNHYRIAPSQLVPNGWRGVLGFAVACSRLGRSASIALFIHCFLLKKQGDWYYFTHRGSVKVVEMPNKVDDWKGKFFWVKDREPFDFPIIWLEPQKHLVNKLPKLDNEDEVTFNMLKTSKAVLAKDLKDERTLFEAGLSRVEFSPKDFILNKKRKEGMAPTEIYPSMKKQKASPLVEVELQKRVNEKVVGGNERNPVTDLQRKKEKAAVQLKSMEKREREREMVTSMKAETMELKGLNRMEENVTRFPTEEQGTSVGRRSFSFTGNRDLSSVLRSTLKQAEEVVHSVEAQIEISESARLKSEKRVNVLQDRLQRAQAWSEKQKNLIEVLQEEALASKKKITRLENQIEDHQKEIMSLTTNIEKIIEARKQLSKKLTTTEERLCNMEIEKVLAIEEAAANAKSQAVEEFKNSDEYRQALLDKRTEDFFAGVEFCKKFVLKRLPDFDFTQLEEDAD